MVGNMLAPPAIFADNRVVLPPTLLISSINAGTAVSANFAGRGSCGAMEESGSII
jgi:hypothetical protein